MTAWLLLALGVGAVIAFGILLWLKPGMMNDD